MKITITTNHPASSYGVPVCLLDGEPANDPEGLRACMELLGWRRAELARRTAKSLGAVDNYIYGRAPVPAEVWNVLAGAIDPAA